MSKELGPPQHISGLTHRQLGRLAPLAKTTQGSLRGYQNGMRRMSAEMAIRVEKAAKRLGLNLPRELHAGGCSTCEFARICRKEGL
jgi:hypothetical protein